MNNNPLVSVIIPAYNAGKYIEMAVRSVLNQSYTNIELIVVNDGSTDSTLDVLSQFSDINIISTPNKGVSHARNVGIDASNGEYISFLDADDELEHNAIEILVKSIKKHKADICAGLSYTIFKKEENFSEQIFEGDSLLRYCIEDNPYTYSVWAKLYKKEFVNKTRFSLGVRAHQDAFFNFELALKEPKCVQINKIIYYYRVHEANTSRKNSDSFLDINRLARTKYEIVLKKYPQYKDYAKNIIIKANMASLNKLLTVENDCFKDYEKKCLKSICENAAYFIPATKYNKMFFFIITHHLYWPFKKYLYLNRFFHKKIMILKSHSVHNRSF